MKRSWVAKNRERIRLIHKKYAEGLDEVEAAQLARLQREVGEHIHQRFPRSTEALDDMEARIAELKARVTARKNRRGAGGQPPQVQG